MPGVITKLISLCKRISHCYYNLEIRAYFAIADCAQSNFSELLYTLYTLAYTSNSVVHYILANYGPSFPVGLCSKRKLKNVLKCIIPQR